MDNKKEKKHILCESSVCTPTCVTMTDKTGLSTLYLIPVPTINSIITIREEWNNNDLRCTHNIHPYVFIFYLFLLFVTHYSFPFPRFLTSVQYTIIIIKNSCALRPWSKKFRKNLLTMFYFFNYFFSYFIYYYSFDFKKAALEASSFTLAKPLA